MIVRLQLTKAAPEATRTFNCTPPVLFGFLVGIAEIYRSRKGRGGEGRVSALLPLRRCRTSTLSRRLASARQTLAPKREFISARALNAGDPEEGF